MPRNKRSDEDQKISAFIGKRVAEFRHERQWSLNDLAKRLGISAPHLKSLESGRYSFSAPLLYKLAAAFSKPAGALMPGPLQRRSEPQANAWRDLYDNLTARDRQAVLELGRNLAGAGDHSILQFWKRMAAGKGQLISLEGIDGTILKEQGQLLVNHLNKGGDDHSAAKLCLYDFDSELWKFIINRFKEMEVDAYRAFERTLFFACERIHRQETRIRPLLNDGKKIVTTFFSLAPLVYQQMEGLMDVVVIQAMSNFFIEPQITIILDSDAGIAAKRATSQCPEAGQFWSPYRTADLFERARKYYLTAIQHYQQLGAKIELVNANQQSHKVASQIKKIVASNITN